MRQSIALVIIACWLTVLLGCHIVNYKQQHHGSTIPTNRRELRVDKHDDFEHLRFLVFGTSRAYGIGIAGLHKSFPYLLSRNNTKNVAMKASGPQYSALCTESMVGVGLYDVIVLEYNLLANDYLMILAQRLRARFPQAIMIFLRIWLPFQFTHLPSQKAVLPMIRERYGPAPTIPATKLLSSLVEGTKPEDWRFNERHDKKALLEKIAAHVGGHVYHMPRPENSIEALSRYAMYYTPDMNHFTMAGHRFFAFEIIKLLHELKASSSTELGEWKERDSCDWWYETSKIAAVHDAPMVNFLTTRYGLEFSTPHNYILAKNPFDQPVNLWIDYMAGAPEGTYPPSRIHLSTTMHAAVDIDPVLRGNGPLHVMQHAEVGHLEAHQEANLTIEALDSGTKASEQFRVVGIIYSMVQVDKGELPLPA